MMSSSSSLPFLFLSLFLLFSPLAFAHSPSCRHDHHNHHEGRGDHIHHRHDHGHHHHDEIRISKLAEEIAEEEDLALHGFDHHYNQDLELSTLGLWVNAMGCSLLVSLASLICLIILPVICLKGKPSKAVVDCLAVFGAGAMLGDAFLHQLPHAFGGGHSHSHEHHFSNIDDPHHGHGHEHGHSHAHSLQDLSLGLSVLFGIILFLLVEKIVRYVEENAEIGVGAHGHHHHHHHERQHKLKEDDENNDVNKSGSSSKIKKADLAVEEKLSDADFDGNVNDDSERKTLLRKRTTSSGSTDYAERDSDAINGARNDPTIDKASSNETLSSHSSSSLIFGYLNLFSDGVHNFTDGMTLGSAFLLHGSVGGWSRTLFLLAHELPQEIGDFGILVRSGFTVSKALFYNFLSALVALAGTALALILGKDPGHSALIEGFTAGGFIYIAVAGVLPGMNNGKTTVRGTAAQLISLISGMTVALCISLVE